MNEKKREIRIALCLGIMCTLSYLGCYIVRSLLSVVSPQMIVETDFTLESIGMLSTGYMICYGAGQLVNGRIGDLINTKYMVGGGLFLAGICNAVIPFFDSMIVITILYSMVGFFLSMIYAPIVKTVAENTRPVYAMRCSLGFTVASYLGTPIASVLAMIFDWDMAFIVCGLALMFMGTFCFVVFTIFEKKKIIKAKIKEMEKSTKIDMPVLFEKEIVKYTVIAIVTGIVRTSVVFWVPTYLTQHLHLSEGKTAVIFTIITLIKTMSPFINTLLIYDLLLKRNINLMMKLMFVFSAISFGAMFFVPNVYLNVLFLTIALLTSAGASSMIWSVYCPSYAKTGMVSTVTGFLDAMSYFGAAVANLLFSNAVEDFGWGNMILIWTGLTVVGGVVVFIKKRAKKAA